MRRAVEFDREAMLDAEEIHDIAADGDLPAKLQPVEPAAAQRPPQHRLGLCHLAPKLAGESGVVFGDAGGHGEVSLNVSRESKGRVLLPFTGEGSPAKSGRMRDAAAWLELPEKPHLTPLRGATFSHEWEKDLRP